MENNYVMDRIQSFSSALSKMDIDGLMVSNVSNVSYLSSFSGDSSILFIFKDEAILITDQRYFEQAQMECKNVQVIMWHKEVRYGYETYQLLINKYNIKKLGIEVDNMSLATYKYLKTNLTNVELVTTSKMVEHQRIIKNETEIQNLKLACKYSDKALQETLPEINPGLSEIEVVAKLEYNLRTSGADNISFETIMLTGKRTSLLHGKPSASKIKAGDYLLFDFGALINGYHADVSRTLMMREPSKEQKELYYIIKDCQQAIINEIKEGIHISHINKIIYEMIPDKYKTYFYNGYGHGVGLDIHEEPFLSLKADFIFKKGMVITIEPGIYIPDWGGLRIEDTILVTEKDAEPLSSFNKDLIVL